MEPNQHQYSIDYLNQIAPQQRSVLSNNKLFFIVIGVGVLIVALAGFFLLSGGGGPNVSTQTQTIAAKLQTLEKISKDASQSNTIKSGKLKSLNASLLTQLTNTNQKITTPMEKNKIPTKLPKKITTKNAETDLQDKLEDARLNAVFDRVYSTNMAYQLKSVILQMDALSKRTKSSSIKEFVASSKENLVPIQEQLAEIATKSE